MPLSALALVLLAALLHAGWNLLVKASPDRLSMSWMQLTFGALCFAPFLVVGGFPTDRSWSVVASSFVHLGYGLALVGAYDRADLSLVYPIARGVAPALVTAGAIVFLSDVPDAAGFVAVGLIVVGIVGVARRRGVGVRWALLTGALIATYTLIDGHAVRQGDEAFRYTIAVIVGDAALFSIVTFLRRGPMRMLAAVRADGGRAVLGGVASVTAYILVLAAAINAPLGLVAAVRETSVVLGALGGWLLLKEPFGPARVRGALLIAAGVMLLVAFR